MGTCSQTNIPVLNPGAEPCNGIYTPTTCIVHTTALTALGIPANSTLSEILVALTTSLNSQNILINNLTESVNNLQIQVDDLTQQLNDCCE